MLTPVGDYMEPVKKDFGVLIEYFEKYYGKKINESKILRIKKIHKMIWILVIWKNALEEDDEYYADIIRNLVSILHIVILNDTKIINFLTRNTIENYIKYCKKYFSLDVESPPRDIFPVIFKECEADGFIHDNFKIIKSVYSDSCKFVHNIDTSSDICICLKEYENLRNDRQMDKLLDSLNKIVHSITNILCIKEKCIFMQINIIDQGILRDYIKQEDLLVITSRN